MAKRNSCEKYGYLDRLSTDQLEELLRADFESDEHSDVDVIFHILEVIEKRERTHPTGRLPDTKLAWEEFQQYYNIPEGEGVQLYPYEQGTEAKASAVSVTRQVLGTSSIPHAHRALWNVLVASIAIFLFFGGMVVAQAAGYDVFGAIGQWTEETFHFASTGDAEEAYANRNSENLANAESSQYHLILKETLQKHGIIAEIAPSWYPDDVSLLNSEVFTNEFSKTILFSFSNDYDKLFYVDITIYQSISDLNMSTFEKDSTPVDQYTSGGKTFYILSNDDTLTATWASETLVETIAGNLSLTELKSMIDSIGG